MLKLLSDGVNPEGSGRSLYFSYFYDVTLTAQRTSVVARDTTPGMQVAVEVGEDTSLKPLGQWDHSLPPEPFI